MKRAMLVLCVLCFSLCAFAGFKAKSIRPKKPDQYQVQVTSAGVTFAADLLMDGKNQKEFFYKELTPSNIIAVRLAIFNNGKGEVILPVDRLQFLGPDGKEIPPLAPETVAEAVLQGMIVAADVKERKSPVAVAPNTRTGDPRTDRTDPRYDPRLDPSDPSYDPTDPSNRRYDNRPYSNDPWSRPGVDVIMNPGGGGGGSRGDLSQFEKQLAEKDFSDKAHSVDPLVASMTRDRFLYFSMPGPSSSTKGYTLRVPPGKGIPQEVVIKF
jgi:hypothetical protein